MPAITLMQWIACDEELGKNTFDATERIRLYRTDVFIIWVYWFLNKKIDTFLHGLLKKATI